MQENWLEIQHAFNPSKDYVLAVITATSGSTYRKVGTMMLVDEHGNYTGLLSGGCLESDICLHADSVFESGKSKILTYDLKADADLLWGMGLGCEGTIDIALISLTPKNNHQGIAQLLTHLSSHQSGYYCLSKDNDNFHGAFHPSLPDKDNLTKLIIPVVSPFKVSICGAGPDVVPVVKMMTDLGWRIDILDHRPEHLARVESFGANTIHIRAEKVSSSHFENSDAIVIMSHHLHRDGLFLSAALSSAATYIGLLGPSGRRDKLLNEKALTASDVKGRVYGPIGLDIGGRTPVAIALSICAQIQEQLTNNLNVQRMKPFWLEEV